MYLKRRELQRQSGQPLGNTENMNSSSIELDQFSAEKIKKRVRDTIREWVNIPSKGEEGFCALHFAAFHGNIKLIKLFVRNGANVNAKNR